MTTINPLVVMHTEGRLGNTGASHLNEVGREACREIEDAVESILLRIVQEHGPIDVRMFWHIGHDAVSTVCLERLF